MITSYLSNTLTQLGRQSLINVRDFIYPPLCLLCGNPLVKDHDWFCFECVGKLDANINQRDACPRCSNNQNIRKCTCDLAWDHYFEKAFSFFDFDETVQHIAHQFKYKGKKSVAYFMGKQYAHLVPDSFFESIDGILSVPLHFFRKMNRGYNQADYLARGILCGSENRVSYFPDVLLRVKNTKTQTKLDKEERQKNLSNAFIVPQGKNEKITGKNLILVDDVITTGATTDLCTQVLLSAGVKSVSVLSLART